MRPDSQRTPRLGQERDALGAEVPARRLGEVARVGVLGRQRDEPAPQLLVERGDDERQRRVGDARAHGERLGELAQALAPLDLAEERVQHGKLERRTVHDERRETRSRRVVIVAREAS